MYKKIFQTFDLLTDSKRFFCLQSVNTNSINYYDANCQSMYSVDRNVVEFWQENNSEKLKEYLRSIPLEKVTAILNFCNQINSKKEDFVADLNYSKANVMINTSSRCNLNCAYCYRDKNPAKILSEKQIKNVLDFAVKQYKPDASEVSISYAMTSESSLDLELMKSFADEYCNFESYFFTEEDFYDRNTEEFKKLLKRVLVDRYPEEKFSDIEDGVIEFLNDLLKRRNLYELLEMSDFMFEPAALGDLRKRSEFIGWKYIRINRWALDIKFDRYIKKKVVPYIGFWFMSNGTNNSKDYMDFIKGVGINPFWISIDGPKDVHDNARKYNNGNASYFDVVKTIKVMQKNGINIKTTSVLTNYFPKPLDVALHLSKLGIDEIVMTPIRPGNALSFDENSIEELIKGYDAVFEKFENDVIRDDFSLIHKLREDLCLAPLFTFISRTKLIKRCDFDDQVVINQDGKLYPCLYFVDNSEFDYGNINDGFNWRKVSHKITVIDREPCKDCWCRYLCGGTCFYGAYKATGDYKKIDPIECKLKKYLCERNLKFLVFLKEHNISLGKL